MSRGLSLEHGPTAPVCLAEPSEGKAAYIEEKDLYDPWNRPYQYDPNTMSKTGNPLIYSQGANPGASPPIRNFK